MENKVLIKTTNKMYLMENIVLLKTINNKIYLMENKVLLKTTNKKVSDGK